MEADERRPSELPPVALAMRRGAADSPSEREPELGRRLDFIPILSPVVEEVREPWLRARVQRVVPGLMATALIGTLVVALANGGPDRKPLRPQKLLTGVPGVLEAREPAVEPEPIPADVDVRELVPRTARVKVKRPQSPGREPRRTSVALASGGSPVSSEHAGASGSSSTTPESQTRSKKKSSSTTAPKPPPQPSRPLYHLYKGGRRNDHWFTINAAERDDRIARGYEMVAVEGLVFGRARKGTLPLNTDDGIAGHIYQEQRDGSVPLYMFRGYNGYGDLFTSDESRIPEYEEQGWNPYGIVGHVLPAN